MLGEDLALGVVADDLDVDEAADVEDLGAEHRHNGGDRGGLWWDDGLELSWDYGRRRRLRTEPHYFLGISRAKHLRNAKLFIGC